ncbi:MAG: hypothetical protein R3E02_05575 [Blastomonas sp.]
MDETGSSVGSRQSGQGLLQAALALPDLATELPVVLKARLFPDSGFEPREDDLGLVSAWIDALREQVENGLADAGAGPEISGKVSRRPFSDRAILTQLMARAVEMRLARNAPAIGMPDPELPEAVQQRLGSEDPDTVEIAMALLIAQCRFLANGRAFHLDLGELSAERTSGLVWRSVSQLQDDGIGEPVALRAAAEKFLAGFDEREGRPHALERFCHWLALPEARQNWSVAHNGPALLLAMLARVSGLGFDACCLLCIEPGLARLAIVARAAGLSGHECLAFLADMAELARLGVHDLPDLAAIEAVGQDEAQQMVARWRNHAASLDDWMDG